jgi:hypothetical protein
VRPVINKIVSLMTVPLVQGTLRYAYKVGEVPADRSPKNTAEGFTFAAAVLPLISSCNADDAAVVSSNMKAGQLTDSNSDGLYDTGTFPSFSAVKAALEDTYPCLGITCGQVGALSGATTGGRKACTPNAGYFKIRFVAAGTVSDYTPSVIALIQESVAKKTGVAPSQVSVEVSSGSVIIDIKILATTLAQLRAVRIVTEDAISTPTGATTFLGGTSVVQVEVIVSYGSNNPTVMVNDAVSSPQAAPAGDDHGHNELPTWGIVVVTLLAVLSAVVCVIVFFLVHKEKSGQPVFIPFSKSTSSTSKMGSPGTASASAGETTV